jgi:GAF domain-containing protein
LGAGEEIPEPVLVEDEDVSGADLSRDLKETILREGIGAVAFIPILRNRKLAGKFMAYYDRPNRLDEPQIEVALTLARQLSFSVARLEAEEARRAGERGSAQLSS